MLIIPIFVAQTHGDMGLKMATLESPGVQTGQLYQEICISGTYRGSGWGLFASSAVPKVMKEFMLQCSYELDKVKQ